MKAKETVTVPMLDTGCLLVSIFTENMNTTRKLQSLILKKGGPEEVAIAASSPVDCAIVIKDIIIN